MRAKPYSSLPRMACILALWGTVGAAYADVYVIANPATPIDKITQQQIADLYLGRTRTLQAGSYVTLIDQSNEQPVRERFFRAIANMSLSQVNAYWARLTFTGRQQPPQPKSDDTKVIEAVSRDPLAIGYVSNQPPAHQVRVILHLYE
ncbi:MAG TPA: hypothetical protein VNZ68_03720 [Rhodocyclaceae bacterium]|nr:hypothetical protein [Rhodocyclaceae bacterium]